MPIVSADLLFKYSVTSGAAGNSTAGTVATSNGKYVSTSTIPDGTGENIFPDITGDENADGNVDYRCIFILNNHATLTLENAVCWLASEVVGGATAALATDDIAVSAKGASAAQAAQIADKDSAPTGVSAFSAPTTKGTGLALGDLGPGQVKAIWLRRTATNSVALNNDGVSVRIEGDTAA